MKLYNQRRVAIHYDGGGHSYAWEPYGSCVVPDSLLPHMKASGFPVSVTPVPPEARATAVADDAATAQRGDELEKLKAAVALAKAETAAAKVTVEESAVKVTALLGELESAKTETSKQAQRAEQFDSDRSAAESLLAETAKKLESAEARVLAAEAERDIAKAELAKAPGADKNAKK